MKSKKTDQRSKYTQMILKDALLKLAIHKPLNKITVTELCAAAGTNRITFYNHFYDIYDVYETIEGDFYKEIMDKLATLKTLALEVSIVQELVLHLYRNADMCRLFVNNNSDMITKIMNAAQDQYVAEFSATYTKIPLQTVSQLFTYLLTGGVGVIIDWIKKGMPQSPEEISVTMLRFNKCALDGITKSLIQKD